MGRDVVGVAKAAMNRGHALSSSPHPSALEEAISAYTEAIHLLDTIPLEPTHANALGAALMNRGQLRHRHLETRNTHLALSDFQRAETILSSALESPSPWPRRNLVGTYLNHANLLLDLGQIDEAMSLAVTALDTNIFTNPVDPTDCELSVLAARTYCDAVGQLLPSLSPEDQTQLAKRAGEQANTGLAHIRTLRPYVDHEPFAEASDRLFRFGCLLHATQNPRKLNAFIQKHITNLQDSNTRTQFHTTAKQAIHIAIQSISDDLLKPTTSPEEQDALTLCTQTLGALFTRLSTR